MKAHKTILLPCNTPFSSLSIRIWDFIRRMQALRRDVSIISRWQVFDSQIHQWGLKMYWLIKQSTFLEVPSPFGNQIIIAIPTPWLSNGIFQWTKGFLTHSPYQPTIRFIFFVGFWNNEDPCFTFSILQRKTLRFSELRSWATYMNKVCGRQKKYM